MDHITTQILADGADLAAMIVIEPMVAGFTTNPSLIKQAGVIDYARFGRDVLAHARNKPVSFEVLSDDFEEMARQARWIATWGPNVYVKIPITNTKGESSGPLIHELSHEGIKVNVTAILHRSQVEAAVEALSPHVPAFISVFAGRIADTGQDPMPLMDAMAKYVQRTNAFLIWASAREIFNVVQASECGCHYITLSQALLAKLPLLGRDPLEYSLQTVREFYRDGQAISCEVNA
jgi:transaldolase